MFKTTEPPDCTITWEGAEIPARQGEPLAATLLAAGVTRFRTTPVSGADRAPFCMMGACFDCLVELDGRANVQACMVTVRPGLNAKRQIGARQLPAEGDAA